MDTMWSIWFFVLGTVLASFGAVVGYRLPKGMKIGTERSQCDTCERQLKGYELIPVLSYLAFGGKCRTCRKKITFLYPAVELLTGALFAFSYIKYGFSAELLIACSLIFLSSIIFVSDLLYCIISDKVMIVFFVWFFVLLFITEYRGWIDAIGGGLFGFCFLFILAVVSKGGIGGGDIKLMGVIGLVLGFQGTYFTLMIASITGVLVAIVGLMLKKYTRKTAIPFGPYLVIGAMVTYYYKAELLALLFS
ncbi:prepilin peptidase [Fictibacillus barbaricus]|uniref:Leader peptidase (Prepilin peptidase)/N-methyltransferase n=1 Tax=Fictibacillus barbaricus TaxID=182136 RepID=A0ABU1U6B5_9BACL|nr:prepilin peptidase [Fictibacillus barbaricus]MDR7074952.1 leader peptidase (prepilin peptidase)/N-methyltransferase [Fictibacillus barbaricus]